MIPPVVRSTSDSMEMFVLAVPVKLKYSTSAPGPAPATSPTTCRRLLVAGDWTATRGSKFEVSPETPSVL